MDLYWKLSVIILSLICKETAGATDTYHAVVVEYSPNLNPKVDPETNIMKNVKNFIDIIRTANNEFSVDIIVFPEIGLVGYDNQIQYMDIPDASENVNPCLSNTTYEAALIQLSCAARETHTYVVVNTDEKFYNSSLRKTLYFNTDVVFNANGTIIARYRKIHLALEPDKTPSPDKQVVYFDTSFGVRFGLFTCFDIFFENPGVILANKFNITHFVYPTAWFSQLPFITAIQMQYYWSYSHDVVFLASGYNEPSQGSTGTGIYLGRRGPVTYNMTETKETFILHAELPKKIYSDITIAKSKSLNGQVRTFTRGKEKSVTKDKSDLTMEPSKMHIPIKDYIDFYTSKLILVPHLFTGVYHWSFSERNFSIPFTVEELICQNTLCCMFSLNITAVFNKTRPDTVRGDDYSQLFYRLAVFDGIRHYLDGVDAGLQNCAIVSCVNTDETSCGMRSDNDTARPNKIYNYFQTEFIFNSINIVGSFSNNHSAIGPNTLLTGEGDNFGSLLDTGSFIFDEETDRSHNETVFVTFETVKPIRKLVTASLYGRLFSRDNQLSKSHQSNKSNLRRLNMFLLLNVVIYILSINNLIC